MTETNETRTVREYRHRIMDGVQGLPVQRIFSTLRGVQGLSQAQQVERLDSAINDLRETGDKLGEVRTVAVEARDFASERDFAAHQASKGRSVPTAPADEADEDVNPE